MNLPSDSSPGQPEEFSHQADLVEIITLHNMAAVLVGKGEKFQALTAYRRALDIAQIARLKPEEAGSLCLLGETSLALGEDGQAVDFYRQAGLIYRELDDKAGLGKALLGQGKALFESGQQDASTGPLEQAFALLRESGTWTIEASNLESQLNFYRMNRRLHEIMAQPSTKRLPDLLAFGQELSNSPVSNSVPETAARVLSNALENFNGLLANFNPSNVLANHFAMLKHSDPERRRQAAVSLGAMGKAEAVSPLLEAFQNEPDPETLAAITDSLALLKEPGMAGPLLAHLDGPDPLRSRLVAVVLGHLADERAQASLLKSAADSEEGWRVRALRALSRLKSPPVIQALQAAMDDPAAQVREAAIAGLGQARHTPSLDLLAEKLKDPVPEVRRQAANSLGELKDRRAVAPLIAACDDRRQIVRWAVVRALGSLKDPAALEALLARLKDSNQDVRRSAATALGQLADPRAVDGLSAALSDSWWRVGESAQAALKRLKAAPTVAPLIKQLKDKDSSVRRQAACLLGKLGDSQAFDPLLELLEDGQTPVKAEAMEALGRLGDRRAVAPVMVAMQGQDSTTRIKGLEALGQLQDGQAWPAIQAGLQDDNPYLRYYAIQAAGQVGDPQALPELLKLQEKDSGRVILDSSKSQVKLATFAAEAIRQIKQAAGLK